MSSINTENTNGQEVWETQAAQTLILEYIAPPTLKKISLLSTELFNIAHRKIHSLTVSRHRFITSMAHLDEKDEKDETLIEKEKNKITPMTRINLFNSLKNLFFENPSELIEEVNNLKSDFEEYHKSEISNNFNDKESDFLKNASMCIEKEIKALEDYDYKTPYLQEKTKDEMDEIKKVNKEFQNVSHEILNEINNNNNNNILYKTTLTIYKEQIKKIKELKEKIAKRYFLEFIRDYKFLLTKKGPSDEVLRLEFLKMFLLTEQGTVLKEEDLKDESNKEIVRENIKRYFQDKITCFKNAFSDINELPYYDTDAIREYLTPDRPYFAPKDRNDNSYRIKYIISIIVEHMKRPHNYENTLKIFVPNSDALIPSFFGRLTNIMLLSLPKNNLKELPEDFFLAFQGKRDENIDLSYNHLKKIPGSIRVTKKICELNLIGNPIQELPARIPEPANSSLTLLLSIEIFKNISLDEKGEFINKDTPADNLFQTALDLLENGTAIDLYLENPNFKEGIDVPESRSLPLEENEDLLETIDNQKKREKFEYIFKKLQQI